MIKSAENIVEKIWRLENEFTLENFAKKMEDILRFRIICNYLNDLYEAKKIIENKFRDKKEFELIELKDKILIPPEKRERGHRALHLVFKAYCDILFEVQFMTMLQHAWDKKDHNLIYEILRQERRVDLGDKIKMAAMSEMLYIADEFFDSLRKGIIESRKGRVKK